jgi:hypothetical protein
MWKYNVPHEDDNVNLSARDHLEDPCVDGRIILKWILEDWDVGHGLDRGRDRWRAVVNVVMNFRVPYNVGNFLTS